MNQVDRLKSNLDKYISRFYLSDIVKGSLVSLVIVLSGWLVIALFEHLLNFSSQVRTAIFFSFLAFVASLITFQIVIPVLRLWRILSGKDQPEAANEIGKAISLVEDRVSNVLNLSNQSEMANNELLWASLNQRAASLNSIDFAGVIDIKKSWKLVKYLALPLLVFIGLTLVDPELVLNSSKRLIAFDQSFTPPAPFQFSFGNTSLQTPEGQSFTLKVLTPGTQLPENVFIRLNDSKIRLKKISAGVFEYIFERPSASIPFELSASGVYSGKETLLVLPVPKILKNSATIDYPSYTGITDEILLNRSQLNLPIGTKINWLFDLKNTGTVTVSTGAENTRENIEFDDDKLAYQLELRSPTTLNLTMMNDDGLSDNAEIQISMIPDAYPSVAVSEFRDSSTFGVVYFSGKLRDDYGISKLTFEINRLTDSGRETIDKQTIQINGSAAEQSFNHFVSFQNFELSADQELEYHFEVWDNDGVNGPKSTKSVSWKLNAPSNKELSAKQDKTAEKSKTELAFQLKEIDKINKELDAFKKEMLQKKKPDWQDKERMKELLERQKSMMEKLMKKSMAQQKQNELNNQFRQQSEELLEKQKMIEEMFNDLFDQEYKEKYEEYNKLLEQLKKDELLDQLDDMKLDNEQLEKELDRTLELFKQLEFEQKLEQSLEKSIELAKKQEALYEKTENKEENQADLEKRQDELKVELKELTKDLEKLEELNDALEEKTALPDTEAETDKAEDGMENASEELKKNNRKKSSAEQKKAQESLEELSKKLNAFKEQQSEDQASENLDDMRQLLENLIDLSHHQEKVMEELKNTSSRDPMFTHLAKEQKDIIDDTKVVEDSLLALSKRVVQISRNINDEISEVKANMNQALENMTNQQPNQELRYRELTLVNQQLSMTSLNNLAILFDSIIEQMQNESQSKMQGTGQCKKPGQGKSGKPSSAEMKKAQQDLNEQLKKLKEAMEKGESPNGKKPGQKPGMGQPGMSKELARMAAQQSAIREQLRALSNSLDGEGGGQPGNQMKAIEKLMEQTEEDILYQNITQKTLDRQQEILSKLLESEKAERERELDEKRESKTGFNTDSIPSEVWREYQIKKEKELELYRTLPPSMKPFYRNQVNRYFSEFEAQ